MGRKNVEERERERQAETGTHRSRNKQTETDRDRDKESDRKKETETEKRRQTMTERDREEDREIRIREREGPDQKMNRGERSGREVSVFTVTCLFSSISFSKSSFFFFPSIITERHPFQSYLVWYLKDC